MKKLNLILFVIIIIAACSCKEHIDEPVITETGIIRGSVFLENQSEHSNCLIYVDNFDVGYSSDSTGFYSINISALSPNFTGTLKLFYYLFDYALDSAKVEVINGKAQTGVLDLGTRGEMKRKVMKQLVWIDGQTDKYEYKVGEYVTFTARFTNVSIDTVHLFIPSIFNDLGFVFLYREDLPIIDISPPDPVMADRDIILFKTGFYEGKVRYPLLNLSTPNIIPNIYFVAADLQTDSWRSKISRKMKFYMLNNWPFLYRGNSPKFDIMPNKIRYPLIKIIQ